MKNALSYLNNFLKDLYFRIENNTSVKSEFLPFYRIFLLLFYFIFWSSYKWIASVPDSFFRPHPLSITKIFSGFPSEVYFAITDFLIILFFIAAVLGLRARLALIALFTLFLVNNGFMYSFGKIDHSIFSTLIFGFLAFTNCGTKLALLPDKPIRTEKLSISVLSICLVFAFFTAGFEKALNWIDFDLTTSGIQSWAYNSYYIVNRNQFLISDFINLPFIFTEPLDYLGVLFEISGFFFLIYSRKTWHFYLFAAVLFHFLNTIFLNIPYIYHFVIYGVWLLSPIIREKPFIFIILIFPIIFEKNFSALLLWFSLIIITYNGWKNKIFLNQ